MNILSAITGAWQWLRHRALTQLLILVVVCVALFLGLTRYPITLDMDSVEIKDCIKITKHEQFIVRTELSQSGARVNFCQKTYYGKVEDAS